MQLKLSRLKFDESDSPFFNREELLKEIQDETGFLRTCMPAFVTIGKELEQALHTPANWGKQPPDALIHLYAQNRLYFTLDDGTTLRPKAPEQWFSQVWPVMH